MNEFVRAREFLERGLQIALDTGNLSYLADFYNYLALLFILQDSLQQAESYVIKAIQINAKVIKSVWLSFVSYANYLDLQRRFDDCLPLAIHLYRHVDSYGAGYEIVNRYFVQPLIYRMQQHIGNVAWQVALEAAEGVTVEQLFGEIVDKLSS